MFGRPRRYSPVANSDEEKSNQHVPPHFDRKDVANIFWGLYQICLHFLILLLVGILSMQWADRTLKCGQPLASELPFVQDLIDYVDIVFQPGGFTDRPESPSAYFGALTPEKDLLWEELYAVGMTVISKEEYHQLKVETAHLVDDPENYLVTLEIFHQLHCLDYVRHVSYAFTSGKEDHHPDESKDSKAMHVDHCIDYLRQVIMCHGDLTPITLEIVPGVPILPPPNPAPYKPNFAIHHTCRDFNQIYDFALQRNTSGYRVA